MPRTSLLILYLLGLSVAVGVAFLQNSPGYMDADYYMAGGLRLVQGHGFSEIILWNYLDDPQGLPHPSHSYWMPLASILAAFGMWLTGQHDFFSARIPFILLAGLVPPLTAVLAYQLTQRRELALLSGLLAAFPTYNISFLATTDNQVTHGVFGVLFFLVLHEKTYKNLFFLGILAGLMNLTRSDGLLWVALAFAFVAIRLYSLHRHNFRLWIQPLLLSATFILLGYFLITGPWFLRNLAEFGTPMAPGGSRAVLLTRYGETFIYPGSDLTFERWLSSGWMEILKARLNAACLNTLTGLGVQGGIALWPFILIAAWRLRHDARIQVGVLGWLALFLVMSLIFPFAGPRGSFLHAGAALMPLGWAIAPVGLEIVVTAARRRNWFTPQAQRVFRLMLFAINLMITLLLLNVRVINGNWDSSSKTYEQVEARLIETGITVNDVVMVANPPGYYLSSGRPAVVTPDAELTNVLAVAKKYNVRYLILEPISTPYRLIPFRDLQESSPDLKVVFMQSQGLVIFEFVLKE
jgi:hypothetical protein